ncbi:MAG: universal stress protein [Betaproteobacteria bacterium]|nr:universal stress protein [Betaproteobacteria bacterium]
MYRNILVAVDGSAAADAALEHALRLAAEQQAHLHLVHIIDIGALPVSEESALGGPDMAALMRRQGQALLERALRDVQRAGVHASSRLLEGEVFGKRVSELLADEARASGADLVVVGSHGWRGFTRLFLGSVAEGVARLCPMPVMIVHAAPASAP